MPEQETAEKLTLIYIEKQATKDTSPEELARMFKEANRKILTELLAR